MRKNAHKTVFDRELGNINFPISDTVMSLEIERLGIWEENEVKWLKKNVTPGDICLNVGANVGYFSILMAQLTGESGTVYAFEPNPKVARCFKSNISTRNLNNVIFKQIAIGNKDGFTKLYLNRRNYGDSRTFNPKKTVIGGDYKAHGFENRLHRRIVPIRKLDNLIQSCVDVVLIDTQGFDHLVIRGMRDLIRNYSPRILTEFVPGWIKDLGEDPILVIEEYQSYGYAIRSDDLHLSDDPTPQEILSSIESSGTFFANLSLIAT